MGRGASSFTMDRGPPTRFDLHRSRLLRMPVCFARRFYERKIILLINIASMGTDDCAGWNEYVDSQPQGNLYHLSEWRKVIEGTYHHNTYYLIAHDGPPTVSTRERLGGHPRMADQSDRSSRGHPIIGVLPLVHIKHRLFGNTLVSIPYFDAGGVVADSPLVENSLLQKAVVLAEDLGVTAIDLRHTRPLRCIETVVGRPDESRTGVPLLQARQWNILESLHKMRLCLQLPGNPDTLMGSFKSKLRSQIRKPIKQGLTVSIGHMELVEDFYDVFAHNMRDLGSPVHAKQVIVEVLHQFAESARLFVVYGNGIPLACSLCIGYKGVLANPWASSLRVYSHLAPNMLLYWAMLEFGCQQGFRQFDFGRSSPGEGSYKFKEQWGAIPSQLHWYRMASNSTRSVGAQPEKDKMKKAINYWKKLPVPLTRVIGPRIRKYISL